MRKNALARGHPAIDGVLPVQEMVVGEVDEELRVGRVGILRARRAQGAAIMRNLGELGLQVRLVRAAGARAAGVEVFLGIAMFHIAGLRHEPVDHAVKDDVVIGALARKVFHAVAVFGGDIVQKLDGDGAVLELDQDGVFGVFDLGHWVLGLRVSRQSRRVRHKGKGESTALTAA